MDDVLRKRIIIGSIVTLFLIIALSLWSVLLRVNTTNLINSSLPANGNEVIITYNHPIDKATASITPEIDHTVSVRGNTVSVVLHKYLEPNTKLQLTIDAQSGIQNNHYRADITVKKSSEASNAQLENNQKESEYNRKYPDLSIINHTDVRAPYKMMYDYSAPSIPGKRAPIVVKYSTAIGRKKAIDWLIFNSIEPANVTIRFDEYVNPLTGESV